MTLPAEARERLERWRTELRRRADEIDATNTRLGKVFDLDRKAADLKLVLAALDEAIAGRDEARKTLEPFAGHYERVVRELRGVPMEMGMQASPRVFRRASEVYQALTDTAPLGKESGR